MAGNPGVRTEQTSVDNRILWGDTPSSAVLKRGYTVASTAADAGNTPTTALRPGLLMALDSNTELVAWNPDATDTTAHLAGVLGREIDTLDQFATARDSFDFLVVQAPLKASSLIIEGTKGLSGVTNEYLARRQLAALNCTLDDDPQNWLSGKNNRIQNVTADPTMVAGDNGKTFIATGGDLTFTLPTLVPGLKFEFIMGADQQLVVASAAGDDIVIGGDASADSVTYTTAGEQIGAIVVCESNYVATTAKWVMWLKKTPFSTDDFLARTIAT